MLGELRTTTGGAAVLPNNRGAIRLAGFLAPRNDSLALVGYADRNDWFIQLSDNVLQSRQNCLPYFFGIMLNPTRLRKVLREFAIRTYFRHTRRAQNTRSDTSCAGVDCDYYAHD
jgi:hypothetical protein